MEVLEEVHQPCEWVNERGKRIGQKCGKKAFLPDKYCTAHQVAILQREPEEVKEPVVIEFKQAEPKTEEIVVKIKTSEQNLEMKPQDPVQDMEVLARIRSLNEEIARIDEEERLKQPAPKSKVEDPPKKVKQTKYNNADILEIMRNYSTTMAKLSELLNR